MKQKSYRSFLLYIFSGIFFSIFSDGTMLKNVESKFILNKDISSVDANYTWTVIGAGPSGIIAVALLLDLGVCPDSILWIDLTFNLGRIGDFYQNVTSNGPNKDWVKFFKASPTIAEITKEDISYIESLNSSEFSDLSIIYKPLIKVTNHLRSLLHSFSGYTKSLEFYDSLWHIEVEGSEKISKSSKNVILATGSKPITLDYHDSLSHEIPLDFALNKDVLKELISPVDTVAVFGGAHSAVLVLKYLSELDVRQIYNFYKNELLYAIDIGGGIILNNETGLRGKAALWAYQVLERDTPINLKRLKNTQENRNFYLPRCNKVIYAIGYQKNTLPQIIENNTVIENIQFDPDTGIIGTRLFGIGIAFPGHTQAAEVEGRKTSIGLLSFIKYAMRVMPEWTVGQECREVATATQLFDEISILENFITIDLL